MALAEICGLQNYFSDQSKRKEDTQFDIINGTNNFVNNTILELPPFGHVSIKLF